MSCKFKVKAVRRSITLSDKLKVIRKLDAGQRQVDIGDELKLSTSTIRTSMKNKENILRSAQTTIPESALRVARTRGPTLEKMEKLLSVWIDEDRTRLMPLGQDLVVRKAKSVFDRLQKKSTNEEESAASKDWFDHFRKRWNRHNIKLSGEAAAEYPSVLKTIVREDGYPPGLLSNVDETELYWKRMPERTFLSRRERRAPGFKVAKDRISLLLGGNASGDFQLKPLLIYPSENPRALKGKDKSRLPVIWKPSKKAWMNGKIFEKWYTNHFFKAVKRHCESKVLEPRALLLIDNAPSHPANLSELDTCISVKVVFLPPNTTSLIQPMDQDSCVQSPLSEEDFRKSEKTEGGDCLSLEVFYNFRRPHERMTRLKRSRTEMHEDTVEENLVRSPRGRPVGRNRSERPKLGEIGYQSGA